MVRNRGRPNHFLTWGGRALKWKGFLAGSVTRVGVRGSRPVEVSRPRRQSSSDSGPVRTFSMMGPRGDEASCAADVHPARHL